MILAAGEGTRLKPLTNDTPKPLLPIGGIPLILRQLLWLKYYGVTDVAINLFHHGDKIVKALSDGSDLGLNIRYSQEEFLLGTAGGVKMMEAFFDSTFFVVYGDNLTNADLSEMVSFHIQKQAFVTIALFRHSHPWEVGIVEMGDDNRLTGFIEKPKQGTEKSNLANGGIYICEPGIFGYITGKVSDFGFDVFPKLLEDNQNIFGYLLHQDNYFIDIGTMERYQKVNDDIVSGKFKV